MQSGLKVEAAAIRIGEAVFSLPRPNRHHNVMWWLHTLGIRDALMHDSGFVLSDGTYADRKRAMEVAEAAGQLIQRPGQTVPIAPPNLYSEDLWEGGADLARPEALWTMATRAPSDAALVEALERVRQQLFALCESTEDECIASVKAMVDGDEIAPENVHAVGFYRGRKSEAKAISRAMSDVFRAALAAVKGQQP